jgi:hypothetical protein
MTPAKLWFQTYGNQRGGLVVFEAWDKYSRDSQINPYPPTSAQKLIRDLDLGIKLQQETLAANLAGL